MTWNCPDCTRLKTEFEKFSQVAFDDRPIGEQGQSLVVIQTYSNVGAIFTLREYGEFEEGVFTPALLTNNQEQITDVEEILKYLEETYT